MNLIQYLALTTAGVALFLASVAARNLSYAHSSLYANRKKKAKSLRKKRSEDLVEREIDRTLEMIRREREDAKKIFQSVQAKSNHLSERFLDYEAVRTEKEILGKRVRKMESENTQLMENLQRSMEFSKAREQEVETLKDLKKKYSEENQVLKKEIQKLRATPQPSLPESLQDEASARGIPSSSDLLSKLCCREDQSASFSEVMGRLSGSSLLADAQERDRPSAASASAAGLHLPLGRSEGATTTGRSEAEAKKKSAQPLPSPSSSSFKAWRVLMFLLVAVIVALILFGVYKHAEHTEHYTLFTNMWDRQKLRGGETGDRWDGDSPGLLGHEETRDAFALPAPHPEEGPVADYHSLESILPMIMESRDICNTFLGDESAPRLSGDPHVMKMGCETFFKTNLGFLRHLMKVVTQNQ